MGHISEKPNNERSAGCTTSPEVASAHRVVNNEDTYAPARKTQWNIAEGTVHTDAPHANTCSSSSQHYAKRLPSVAADGVSAVRKDNDTHGCESGLEASGRFVELDWTSTAQYDARTARGPGEQQAHSAHEFDFVAAALREKADNMPAALDAPAST